MKYYLDHKEVTQDEFFRARDNQFRDHTQWSVEHEIDSSRRDITEAVTLTLCGALTIVGLYWVWGFLKSVPL